MRTVKKRARNLLSGFVACFCATSAGHAQVDVIVEVPTAAHKSSDLNSARNMTMGSESSSEKNMIVEEEQPFWSWYSEVGYESQYNFRGTNLTPGADGAGFISAEVSKWDLTLGIDAIHQFGTGRIDTFSTQTRFNEIDLLIHYYFELGPVELTLGDIQYFDDIGIETVLFGSTFRTVEREEANRLFIRLGTSKIAHLQPSITYYQTIYSTGFTLLGYIEGTLRGNFAITEWLDFNPYGVISVSFHERTERFENTERSRTFSGFNYAEVGVELPIHVFHWKGYSRTHYAPPDPRLDFVPFGAYSYHISDPPPGTDRNEVWGGAEFALTF
jgi:hypothetical protein